MKKYLMLFVGLLSLIGISTVKADTLTYDYVGPWVHSKQEYIDSSNEISHLYDLLYDYYSSNYIDVYPYYIISLFYNASSDIELTLIGYPSIIGFDIDSNNYATTVYVDSSLGTFSNNDAIFISSTYFNGTYSSPSSSSTTGIYNMLNSNYVERYNYFANFALLNLSSKTLVINQYDVDHPGFTVLPNTPFPQFQSLQNLNIINDPNSPSSTYQEINLNNYSYIALSLKDYTLRNNNTNQFSTNIYTKGQLCLTPIYDYGMKEKTDYYTGYQVDRCSVAYDNFTPVRTYILKQDLQNHAIYYLKSYNTNIENKVKIDTSIFDITYITSENEDFPSVTINGRSYPTISYNDLSSTATQSEEEEYISGQSISIFDSSNTNFNDIFSNPLNLLKSVWESITSVFSIITEFITILPPQLQTFLYLSFMLAIVLGILKIIL